MHISLSSLDTPLSAGSSVFSRVIYLSSVIRLQPSSILILPHHSGSLFLHDANENGCDLYRLRVSPSCSLSSLLHLVFVSVCVWGEYKGIMNNSEDASTRPPSIKPSPLMSINDNHAMETIKK